MNSGRRTVGGYRFSTRNRANLTWRAAFGVGATLAVLPAFGDGCFVFRWDKKVDINEPTQKAIIVYDAGREDLLLQVRYEGALKDFGWLIAVPALPKVTKGSMQPFYELSQL